MLGSEGAFLSAVIITVVVIELLLIHWSTNKFGAHLLGHAFAFMMLTGLFPMTSDSDVGYGLCSPDN